MKIFLLEHALLLWENASVPFLIYGRSNQNQAGLGFLRQPVAGIFYENRFLLKELSLKSHCNSHPCESGTFGFCFSSFGYVFYHENKYSISFAKHLEKKLSAAIAMDYENIHIAEDMGNKGLLSLRLECRRNL